MKLNKLLQPEEAPVATPFNYTDAQTMDLKFEIPAGKINYTHISKSSRIYTAIVSLSGELGTFKDIQLAINYTQQLGGGTVFIKNGTYLIHESISLPQGVNLQGETSTGVVIDFDGTEAQLNAIGELVYDTGTISATNNSTTVNGVNTIWESSLEGSYMLIKGAYYLIHKVIGGTQIILDNAFSGDNISNESYAIANPIFGLEISNMTLQNSLNETGAVYFEYCSSVTFGTFTILSSTLGFSFVNSEIATLTNWVILFCDSGCSFTNFSQVGFDSVYIANILTGNAITAINGNTNSFFNFSIFGAVGKGIQLTSCYNTGIINFAVISCSGVGLEIESTYDIQILSGNFANNTTDAIKLISFSNRNIMSNLLLRSNGGYGINLATPSVYDNLVIGSILSSNFAGAVNDSGTDTKIRSCIGVADN